MLGDRATENLLEASLAEAMVVFVYGEENNEEKTRCELKSRGVHGVCFDE